MRHASLAALLLLGACGPQNAQIVAGEYAAFLSASNSITVRRDDLNYEKFRDYYAVDCRDFETAASAQENEELRLDNRIPVCRGDTRDDGSTVGRDEWPPPHEIWLDNDGFIVVGDPLEPWRGEAIITSEGDFQLTFHQRMYGEDLRLAIVVDPNFQPRKCADVGDGQVEWQELDGDWLENWSADLEQYGESGTLYYLNANTYHFGFEDLLQAAGNPQFTPQPYYIPQEWAAGFAAGAIGGDRLRVRGARLAPPENYIQFEVESELFGGAGGLSPFDLFWCANDTECLSQRTDQVNGIADQILDTWRNIELPLAEDVSGLPSIRPRVHDNRWREANQNSAGLDGWVELDYSWIRFDEGSVLEQGGSASGDFNLLLDAEDNQTRLLVRGSFDVKRIKKDTWVTEYLPDTKGEEYGTEVCGVPVTELQ